MDVGFWPTNSYYERYDCHGKRCGEERPSDYSCRSFFQAILWTSKLAFYDPILGGLWLMKSIGIPNMEIREIFDHMRLARGSGSRHTHTRETFD